jgi:hypothetical protein
VVEGCLSRKQSRWRQVGRSVVVLTSGRVGYVQMVVLRMWLCSRCHQIRANECSEAEESSSSQQYVGSVV